MPHAAGPLPRDRDHHGRSLRVPVQRTRPPVHLVQSKAVAVAHRGCSGAVAAVPLEYSVTGRLAIFRRVRAAQPVHPHLRLAWDGSAESFFTVSGTVIVGTILTIGFLSGFEDFLPKGWFLAWRDFMWPLDLVLILTMAGVSHFTVANTFCSTVPRWGGLWQVPAPGARALSSEPFVARVRFSLFGRALALPNR